MFNEIIKEIDLQGEKLVLKTGKIARQADGAVMASMGDTVVLCTVVAAKEAKEGADFFPLTVHYIEKAYAAGKIPGGFLKRESKPSDKEVLTSRLIDRPLRPLFPKGFYNEVQVICTVLSHDVNHNPDIVALIGTSAAMAIAGLPIESIPAAARVGFVDGKYVLNPSNEALKESSLDLVVAGTESSVMMVESEASGLTEEQMLDAVKFGHEAFQPCIKAIAEMAEMVGKPKMEVVAKDYSELKKAMADKLSAEIKAAYEIQGKQDRTHALSQLKNKAVEEFTADDNYSAGEVIKNLGSLESDIMREAILTKAVRIDGRSTADVRQIECEVGILPRTHGSALFTRGETQALVVTTLGTGQDEQMIDGLDGEDKERFMLHYNFPPYSVGETYPLRAPGRREVGHGKLAWRALNKNMPSKEQFPYTVRLVSEVTESNGSSSMATVCGSSLALMDAGAPLRAPIAGIAMGLIKEGEKFAILSDIMGDEDHLGDMDFKVAGTKDGITALQMDIKITGINFDIMKQALAQARDGRLHILGCMDKALTVSRDSVNSTAPMITTLTIHKDKIRELIGPGGKVIKEICEKTGAKIDITDEGVVSIATVGKESTDAALAMVNEIVAEPEVGQIYDGTVVKTIEVGAFVNFFGPRDGFVHISEIVAERVEKVEDKLKEGDKVKVKLLAFERGKFKLSIKRANPDFSDDNKGGEKNTEKKSEEKGKRSEGSEKPKEEGAKPSSTKRKVKKPEPKENTTERKYFN